MSLPGDEDFQKPGIVSIDTLVASPCQQTAGSSLPQFLPWLMLLFAGSGCAALIYEIVWFKMLQLVIGSTAVSLGALLASFMGGMCLGSVALSCVVAPTIHPLRVWAFFELGIGLLGVVVLFAMPRLANIYAASALGGLGGILLRGLLCVVCLLPPTLLMGATLPAISRLAETDRK